MSASTLTAFIPIPEGSQATPGLFNSRFQTLQDNIVSVNSIVVGTSVLSGSTWASIGLFANSNNSDYIRFADSAGQRSTYRLGSAAGGTADGLNIFDESGNTMIASFSKQSIRFYQQVVGPVFDLGGALTDTFNASTYGVATDSKESRIQAAIIDASNQGISRVYVPASMYPYSASSVSFIYTVQMTREGGNPADYDVIAYGAAGDGVRNDQAAIQAAIEAAVGTHAVVHVPAGTYKLLSGLTIYTGTHIVGETISAYPGGFGVAAEATSLSFAPTVANSDLFTVSSAHGSGGGFRFHISIGGLYIAGNGGTNSRYALNLDAVIYGNFTDMTFADFATPIRCNSTIDNRFENLFLAGANVAPTSLVEYTGGNETTDVWTHCVFTQDPAGTSLPIGVQFLGSSVGIRFQDCIWESIDNYGMEIAKDCQNITVVDGYSENVPLAANANGCMFRVGYTGSALVVQNHLTVIGGSWFGRNAGAIGNWVDCDSSNGVQIVMPTIARYTNVVRTTANTRINSVVFAGGAGITFTAIANDLTKLAGFYPNAVIGGSNHQSARFNNIDASGYVSAAGPVTAAQGTAIAPGFVFASDNSLGFYATTVAQTVSQSLGSFVVPSGLSVGFAEFTTGPVRIHSGNTKMGLTLDKTGSAARRFQMFVGDGGDGTTADENYIANLNTALHIWGGAAGTTELWQIDGSQVSSRVTTNFNLKPVVSIRTLAASSVTLSAGNTNVAANEMVFTVGGASGASLCIHSGGTVYVFNSALSAKAT